MDTDHLDKGLYVVTTGSVSMFGVSDLKVIGGGTDLGNALKLYESTEPEGNVVDNTGTDARNHAYLMVILKAKVGDLKGMK